MADWLASGEAPAGFSIDQDCELRSLGEDKAAVRYLRHPLEGEDIRSHLQAGKLPTRLALSFDDRVSFVLTDKLEVKRLEFLDLVRDQLEADHDDAEAVFNAEFALMTGELQHLLPALVEALGGELDGDKPAAENSAGTTTVTKMQQPDPQAEPAEEAVLADPPF